MSSIFDEIIDRRNTGCVKLDCRKAVFGRSDVIPLWVADMDFRIAPAIQHALQERINHGVLGYGTVTSEYLSSVANWLRIQHSWQVSPKEIQYAGGVVASINVLVNFLTEKGDKIIVQPPVYFPFHHLITANKRQVLNNQLIYNNGLYSIDFDDFENKCKDGAKIVLICNPHNPSGRVWRKEELEKLISICSRYNVLIFSDEIHSDFVYSESKHIPIASISETAAQLTITFMSPSKTFNIAGLPSSYLVIKNQKLKKLVEEFFISSDVFIVNVLSAIATIAAYNESKDWLTQLLSYLQANRDYISDRLKNELPQVKMMIPEASYLAWLDLNNYTKTESELMDILVHQAGVGLNCGSIYGPGGDKFFRLNFGCPRLVIKEALDKMIPCLNKLE